MKCEVAFSAGLSDLSCDLLGLLLEGDGLCFVSCDLLYKF